MTQLTENVFAVEVPEGAAGFEIDNPMSLGDLVYYLGFPSVFNFRKVSLPAGSWQLLCTTKEATEEQAKGLVLKMDMGFKDVFMNYVTGTFDYDTAVESLNSLLTSKGLDVNKNYVLLKKK